MHYLCTELNLYADLANLFFSTYRGQIFFQTVALIDKSFEHVRNVTHRLTSKLFWAEVSEHSNSTLTIANIMDERIEFMT